MDNVLNLNATQARQLTDLARNADLTFARSLSECLAAVQVAANLGESYARVRLNPEVFGKVSDELTRRGFTVIQPTGADRDGLRTVFDRVIRW